MSDLKSAIMAVDDRPYKDVEVPEWSATVRVRGLSGIDAVRFAETIESGDNVVMAELLLLTLHDPATNERIFGEEDKDALLARSATVLSRLLEHARDLSGLGEADDAKND